MGASTPAGLCCKEMIVGHLHAELYEIGAKFFVNYIEKWIDILE
jgi:hypothetical protein